MAETVIFEEQTLDGFALDENYGAFAYPMNPAPFTLTLGSRYRVTWDGVDYDCDAQDLSAMIAGTIGLGDLSSYGMTGNNEPFAIGANAAGVTLVASDDATSHTVAIYRVTEDATPVGIILRDYRGEETVHYGKERLEVDTTDGGTVQYVREDLVSVPVETTVELDFSGGDMTVTPEDGQAFSAVNIPVPANLTPENIAEGVGIAGIIGTFVGGLVYASGTFVGTGGTVTVQHGLGVVPDIVFISSRSDLSTVESMVLVNAVAISSKVKNLADFFTVRFGRTQSKTSSSASSTNALNISQRVSFCLDCATSGLIHSGNENTFKVGDVIDKTSNSLTYDWFAVGGLS